MWNTTLPPPPPPPESMGMQKVLYTEFAYLHLGHSRTVYLMPPSSTPNKMNQGGLDL